MTVAPRMPSARYSIAGFFTISTVGAKPRITWPQSGSAMAIWMPKQTVMTAEQATMNASIQRKPSRCMPRIRNTSSAVRITPSSSGMPNRRLRPIAVPITSARSVAQMANSASSPERPGDPARIGVAAGLREVAAGRHAEPGAERLEDDRHDVGEQRDRQQRVAELRAASERGRPVAGVHIADGDQIAGPQEGDELLPHRPGGPRLDRAEHIGERRLARGAPPAGIDIVVVRGDRLLSEQNFSGGSSAGRSTELPSWRDFTWRTYFRCE